MSDGFYEWLRSRYFACKVGFGRDSISVPSSFALRKLGKGCLIDIIERLKRGYALRLGLVNDLRLDLIECYNHINLLKNKIELMEMRKEYRWAKKVKGRGL